MTLDVITLSGYGKNGGRKMTPQQRRFKAAAKRCSGNAGCMSRVLSTGTRGYGRKRKKAGSRKRRGMGILPHSNVAGTECQRYKMVWSPVYGKKVKRCAEFGYDYGLEDYTAYDHTNKAGKKVGKPGPKYKRGIWKKIYAKKVKRGGKARSWPGGGTAGMDCKAYKAKGRKCKVRCAWYGAGPKPKGVQKTAAGAKKACKKK